MKFFDLISQNLFFDSHCHLNAEQFDTDRAEVVDRAEKAGVKAIIDVGTDLKSSKKAVENAAKYEIVYVAVGVDPEILIPDSDLFDEKVFSLDDDEFEKWLENIYAELAELIEPVKIAKNEKVLMIGETGIDNYWLEKNENLTSELKKKSLERQIQLFRMHCKLAKKFKKPLTIHSRNAIEKCLAVLTEEKVDKNLAVFHSLTPDIGDDEKQFEEKVLKILKSGYYVGVNGIITFKNADLIRNVYSKIIGEKIENINLQNLFTHKFILETDAPFLAPEPYRGQRNEPAFLKHIFQLKQN